MKQIIASVFLDILSYTIGNIIFCIFKFNNYNCKGLQTSAYQSSFLAMDDFLVFCTTQDLPLILIICHFRKMNPENGYHELKLF